MLQLIDHKTLWPADIRVWRLDFPMDAMGDPCQWTIPAELSDDEIDQVRRYRQPSDQCRFAFTRANLRRIVGEMLDVAPASLGFDRTRHGRPVLAAAQLHAHAPRLSFNVSHSGRHGLIAVSLARDVGVDLERVDDGMDCGELIPSVCSPRERLRVVSAGEAQISTQFMRCWVAKEAILKAVGVGLIDDLQRVEVDPDAAADALPLVSDDDIGIAQTRYAFINDIAQHPACLAYGPSWSNG